MEYKKILVVGGDGFCGWPLVLRLSNLGHDVSIVDNLSRRDIDKKNKSNSLTPISSIEDRLEAWKEVSKKQVGFYNINVAKDYDKFSTVVREFTPNVIVHLGEQRSAPYSMKNSETAQYTVDNNLNATHNILRAIVDIDRDIHLVHIGTMGVYGYGAVEGSIIPEGYVDIMMKNKTGEYEPLTILHPAYPGSVYHMTKTQDALFFQFYAKNYELKITDLHQGIIWGLFTKETDMDPRLINRFDYDSDYGTVLNRFIMQAVYGIPLTIYGTGEQTRAFIHIENSMNCIELAIKNPPNKGDKVKIFNQMTETYDLNTLADHIQELFDNVTIQYVDNPRRELLKNGLEVENKNFLDLGLVPIKINGKELVDIYNYIKNHIGYVNKEIIMPISTWK